MKLKKCSRHFTILPSLAQGGQNFPLKTNVYTVYNKFSSLSTFFTRFNFHLLLYNHYYLWPKEGKNSIAKTDGGHGWISTPLDPSLGGRPVLYLVISFSHRHCIHRPKFARKCTRSRNLEPNFCLARIWTPACHL